MIDITTLIIMLIFIFLFSIIMVLLSIEHKINIFCFIMFVLSTIFLIVAIHQNDVLLTDGITDYSKTSYIEYDKIVWDENKNDPADSAYYVYLKNGDRYKINQNNCKIKLNNKQLSNCIVKAGSNYCIKNDFAYRIKTIYTDTLYVNQNVYDKLTNPPNHNITVIE